MKGIASLNSNYSSADPFDPFDKPVSIGWWQASCKDSYVTTPQDGYAKGYCDGVTLAYMNQLEDWCVPDRVTWVEVQDYLAIAISEANIEPLSQLDIGDWIADAMQVKWPCITSKPAGLVTDPQIIEKLNSLIH